MDLFNPLPPLDTMMDVFSQGTYWRSNDGQIHVIAQMPSRHLRNIVPFLHRIAVQMLDQEIEDAIVGAGWLQGEMATYYADQEIDSLLREDPHNWLARQPVMQAILRELARREGYEWN